MNTPKEKSPREFWIEEWNNGDWFSSTCWRFIINRKIQLIHVIEHSAYLTLQSRLEKCEGLLRVVGKTDSYETDMLLENEIEHYFAEVEGE